MPRSDPEIRLREDPKRYTGHSFEQLYLIEELRLKGSLSLASAVFLAVQMVHHGFPEAISVISDLQKTSRNPAVLELLAHLEARFRAIQGLTWKRAIFRDELLMRNLYHTEGATFIPHPSGHRDLMVVFLTAFNNFGVSNAVLLALLQQCGFSVLLLRDCSHLRFLKGVKGYGGTLHELAKHVKSFCTRNKFERVFVTGYSSGGFASLFFTTLMRIHAYLGFAIESDFSSGGPPATKTRKGIDLTAAVERRYLVSLNDLVSASVLPGGRRFIVGDRSAADCMQSECFRSMPGCSVYAAADCGHEVTLGLLEDGRLLQMFEDIRSP